MKIYRIEQKSDYFASNVFVVENNSEGVLIDAGINYDEIKEFTDEKGITLKYCLLTHGHFDHTRACGELQKNGVKICCLKEEEDLVNDDKGNASYLFEGETFHPFKIDETFTDGEVVNLIGLTFKALKTSGHTKGSCCYFVENACFSGDTLFDGGYGRCDLPTGNYGEMMQSLRKLLRSEKEYVVYTGHGENTVIGKKNV